MTPLRLTVRPQGQARARALLDARGARYEVTRVPGAVRFAIANPAGLAADEHPWAVPLGADLRRSGVPVLAYSVP